MKIIIAPDSFKESMTSKEAADSIEKGFKAVFPDAEYFKIPAADGGEGTVQALTDATGGSIIKKTVTGPLGTPVNAAYGLLGDGRTAVIEMAEASGLHLVPRHLRDPLNTTTRGTGELIADAASRGAGEIIIGLGGSATNDGGTGMASALGVRFLNEEGQEIPDGGGSLHTLASIDISGLSPDLKHIRIRAACDVENPLTGENGASYVFGTQKGASEKTKVVLDRNLRHFADVLRRQHDIEADTVKGAGAAGGLGAGLIAFLQAELQSGIDVVLDTLSFSDQIRGADLVITGEGQIDGQTIFGKTPAGIAARAAAQEIPVIALAGSLGKNFEHVYSAGITAVFSIVPGAVSLEDALASGRFNLESTARNAAALYRAAKKARL
ncbi:MULTISPECIES: glycerate kinase [Bacillus]|uniref:Glycerate kinase n=3 Tax=Bacillus amyloliquefaciens group TaxID=1938374 RepID=A0ABC8D094_BACVE|nr:MULTISPECIES: glycerate kinase [Bacillus]ANB47459.1 glycerate kinase [Bacillus velezensis]AVI26907.1 glycerate kinase [Bacillus velezensis]AWX70555.1 glycerate kinase [Bacillus velezensis]MBR7818200.1 glycerate kinase [Bacillus sp. CCNWLCWHY013]MDE5156325.1 glycerate kinase [Bacillus amyloliquefaciens]